MSNNNTSRGLWFILIAFVGAFAMVSIGVFIGEDETKNIVSKREASCESDLVFCNRALDTKYKVSEMQDLLDRIMLRPKHMETGGAVLEVGRFSNMDKANDAEVELRKYLTDCSNLNDTWFCHPELLDRISILKHNDEDYFLVIKGLNMPTLYNLCSFMWAYSARVNAARHSCSQMSLHEMHEMGLPL